MFLAVVAAVTAILVPTHEGHAALMQTNISADRNASSVDLLQTELFGSPTPATIGGHEGSGTDVTLLADGTALFDVAANGVPNYDDDDGTPGTISPETLAPDNNDTMAFTLDTTSNTAGYNITQIDFYHGWGDNGRDGMRFTVEYSLVGDVSFITYGSTTKFDPDPSYGLQRVTDTSGTIASGVDELRFTPFEIDNGFGGLSEIDVFGSPVPEPATLALAAVGLGVLRRRKRRA